jgi:hypothetical protein
MEQRHDAAASSSVERRLALARDVGQARSRHVTLRRPAIDVTEHRPRTTLLPAHLSPRLAERYLILPISSVIDSSWGQPLSGRRRARTPLALALSIPPILTHSDTSLSIGPRRPLILCALLCSAGALCSTGRPAGLKPLTAAYAGTRDAADEPAGLRSLRPRPRQSSFPRPRSQPHPPGLSWAPLLRTTISLSFQNDIKASRADPSCPFLST